MCILVFFLCGNNITLEIKKSRQSGGGFILRNILPFGPVMLNT